MKAANGAYDHTQRQVSTYNMSVHDTCRGLTSVLAKKVVYSMHVSPTLRSCQDWIAIIMPSHAVMCGCRRVRLPLRWKLMTLRT